MPDQTTSTQREQQWQEHISRWQTSGLNQKNYCEQSHLSYYQFGYWRQRLKVLADQASVETSTSGFAAIRCSGASSSETLVVRLPCGLSIEGINTHNVQAARQLLRKRRYIRLLSLPAFRAQFFDSPIRDIPWQ